MAFLFVLFREDGRAKEKKIDYSVGADIIRPKDVDFDVYKCYNAENEVMKWLKRWQ